MGEASGADKQHHQSPSLQYQERSKYTQFFANTESIDDAEKTIARCTTVPNRAHDQGGI